MFPKKTFWNWTFFIFEKWTLLKWSYFSSYKLQNMVFWDDIWSSEHYSFHIVSIDQGKNKLNILLLWNPSREGNNWGGCHTEGRLRWAESSSRAQQMADLDHNEPEVSSEGLMLNTGGLGFIILLQGSLGMHLLLTLNDRGQRVGTK